MMMGHAMIGDIIYNKNYEMLFFRRRSE